jgi:hypothetical protein
MTDEFLSSGEFSRWLPTIDSRLKDHGAALGRIEVHLATLNGRTSMNTMKIEAVETQVKRVQDEDRRIKNVVTEIHDKGCRLKDEHERVIEALTGAGALLNTDGERPCGGYKLPTLSRKQRVAAGAGLGALLIPALSDLFQFGHAVFEWLMK